MKRIYRLLGTIGCVLTASGSGPSTPGSATSDDRPLPRLLSPAQIAKRNDAPIRALPRLTQQGFHKTAVAGRTNPVLLAWSSNTTEKLELARNLTKLTRNAAAISGIAVSHGH